MTGFKGKSLLGNFLAATIKSWFPKPVGEVKPNSIFALMPDGSMKKGSLGLMIYKELLRAYSEDYEDDVDKEAIFYAMSGNYTHETESAWQAFLAKINFDE